MQNSEKHTIKDVYKVYNEDLKPIYVEIEQSQN